MKNNKQDGNAYERKIAKQLSIWIFNDKDFLKRHSTSGADKSVWCGDIIPMKQLPDEWNKHFPFFIETKHGYSKHKPTFWKYTQIIKWLIKAHSEYMINNQNVIWLICQFKNQRSLFITNKLLPIDIIKFNVAFPYIINNNIMYGYVYSFLQLLDIEFPLLFMDCIKRE